MNKVIKKKWIEALKSNEFKKGTGELRSADDKYCCLGVLCSLHGRHEWVQSSDAMLGGYEYAGRNDFLPEEVAKWAELEEELPFPREQHDEYSDNEYGVNLHLQNTQEALAALNDHRATDNFGPVIDFIYSNL